METVEKRNGLQKSEIEKLKQMHERDSQSIQVLEKSLAQKNKHIEILVREKERQLKAGQENFREFLDDKVELQLQQDRSQTENYILEKNADLKAQLGVYRDKVLALKEELASKEKEIQKTKEDNFYLVTRLKNMRPPKK